MSFTHSMFVPDKVESFATNDHDLRWMSLSRTDQVEVVPTDLDKLSLSSHEHPKIKSEESSSADHHTGS